MQAGAPLPSQLSVKRGPWDYLACFCFSIWLYIIIRLITDTCWEDSDIPKCLSYFFFSLPFLYTFLLFFIFFFSYLLPFFLWFIIFLSPAFYFLYFFLVGAFLITFSSSFLSFLGLFSVYLLSSFHLLLYSISRFYLYFFSCVCLLFFHYFQSFAVKNKEVPRFPLHEWQSPQILFSSIQTVPPHATTEERGY